MKNKTKLALIMALISLASWATAQCNNFAAGSSYYEICVKVIDVGCNILAILQGIIAAVAVLVIVLAGHQWITSGFFEDPQRRNEAKEKIVQTIVGVLVAMCAMQLIVLLFGGNLGSISC
jgi:type IV secretory pathway VirB2 component (pilin)